MRGVRPTRRMALLAGVLTSSFALIGPGALPAHADPADAPSQQQIAASRAASAAAAAKVGSANAALATADAQLEQLGIAVAQAAEAYDAAVYKLQVAQGAAAEAQRQSDAAQNDLAAARKEAGKFAAATYRAGGDLGQVSALLGASGPQSLVDRSTALAAVADKHGQVLDRVRVEQVVGDVLAKQAADALAAAQDAAAAVAAAKADAEARVAAQQSLVGSIQQTRDAATQELQRTTAATADLERQRRDALAREAARRAAEEAAARQAQAARDAAARQQRQQTQRPPSTPATPSSDGNGGNRPPTVPTWSPPPSGGVSRGTIAGAARAIDFARAQLGKPYVWAGAGPDTFDCSGLTMRAWEAGGVALPHWAAGQYELGKKVSSADARPGDLVFFASDPTDPSSIYHVGLYIGGGQMIEAPYTGANVRISSINRASFFGFSRP